jgi:anti-sigma factor RsiW
MIRNCDDFNDRLLAYMEREDDDATREAMERHAASCAECGALLAELKQIRVDASELPEMQPSRDLWSGIAARIEAPVVPIGEHVVEVKRTVRVRRWTSRILIAASLMGAAGIGYAARGTSTLVNVATVPDTVSEPAVDVAASPDSSPVAATTMVAANRDSIVGPPATAATPRPLEVQLAARAVASLAADYDREVGRLQRLLEQRRNQLDPATVAVIEKNLLVIDTAIAESKKAIARDPASEFLIESLNQSLRAKVELMRTAALLPSRT